ncbi:hypothetical protein Back2_10970 [Nocardioides baekrokdamisoli]|uniref:VOC domain-containing protein n=1 Tax=Nocardioides baekrokdamisoli TaxID=1804624 RepID=A0A3G9ICW8_9ACTN|nr:VOC family protein [Nocardioides baekrokdamisoli]BBH16810.1 hypothetical protein Back2_10970 [Nocardioides baekrokdamisoli]
MTLKITTATFDCDEALPLAQFWASLLGWHVFSDADPEILVAPSYPPPPGMCLLFIPVPEGKTAKNRIHFDLTPTDSTRDAQVEVALAAGAQMIDDRRAIQGDGGWAVLADPEGNEFCILRSDAERTTRPSRTFRIEEL